MNHSILMRKAELKWIVTANYTSDGAVAYFRADQSFGRKLDEAAVFDTKDAAEAARQIALGAERLVSDPYLTEVAPAPQGLDALTARERIRSQGPTVRIRRPDPSPLTHPAAERSSRPAPR
jgi:hypothetical protein